MIKTVWIIDLAAISNFKIREKKATAKTYVEESLKNGYFVYDSKNGGKAPYPITFEDGEKEAK